MIERTFVGLDVHAKAIVACALDTATGEAIRAKMNPDPVAVLAGLQTLAATVQVVYEDGPTGYGLSRFLTGHGVDCLIAAPSKLMRAPGDHVKNDRRDWLVLARMLSLGQVTRVRVPTEEQEALRDLLLRVAVDDRG